MDFPKIARRAAIIGLSVIGILLVGALAYVYSPNLVGSSKQVLATIEGQRLANLASLNKAVVAPPAVTTEAVTTDTGRAVYVETTRKLIDPVAEIETMKKSLASATKSMAEQALEMQRQAAAQVAALTTTFNSTVEGLKAEIAKKNEPASAPAPAPVAASQPASAPVQALASNAKPSSGSKGLIIPDGFHLVTVGDAANQNKMKTCAGTLRLDTRSPKCYWEKGVQMCPWKCE